MKKVKTILKKFLKVKEPAKKYEVTVTYSISGYDAALNMRDELESTAETEGRLLRSDIQEAYGDS